MYKLINTVLIFVLFTSTLLNDVYAEATIYMKKGSNSSPFRKGESSFGINANASGYTANIPAVLSPSDIEVYKRMFKYQRALDRKKVVQLLPMLQNRILIGDVIAERILHPKTKTPYIDMKNWLADYHGNSQAKAIYSLANKRKPRKEKHAKPSVKRTSLAHYHDPDEFLKETQPSKAQKASRSRKKMLVKLKRYRIKKQYEKAINIYKQKGIMKILSRGTWQQAGLKLSESMMYSGVYDKAQSFSTYIADKTPESQPKALWVAGFSAYRQGKVEVAAKLFRRLFYTVPKNSNFYAKAAWWTARTNEEIGLPSIGQVFINLAAEDKYSFYGHLARERLGRNISDSNWNEPGISLKISKELFKNKVIKRVIALSQIGEYAIAQNELKTIYDKIPYDWDESLLALSLKLDLPATSLTLARNLKEQNKPYLAGLYPVLNVWNPRGGNKIDKSLTYAIIRQESAFNPKVISRAGARGLMQLMPATAKFIRRMDKKPAYSKHALLKPSINMMLGQTYLAYLHKKFSGNLTYTIASYNAGPGNVRKWVKNMPSIAQDPVLFIESIPFAETRKYVTHVISNLWVYKQRFQQDTPLLSAFSQHKWGGQVADIGLGRNKF